MKIRSGFVSNSSSSSYIVVGVNIAGEKWTGQQKKDLMDRNNFEYNDTYYQDDFFEFLMEEMGLIDDDNVMILGESIRDSDPYDWQHSEVSLGKLQKMAKKVQKNLKSKLDMDISLKDIKLMSGSSHC